MLAHSPASGFDLVTSDALLGLALVSLVQGRCDEALVHVDEAIARGRRAESPMAEARALVGRGYVQLARAIITGQEAEIAEMKQLLATL